MLDKFKNISETAHDAFDYLQKQTYIKAAEQTAKQILGEKAQVVPIPANSIAISGNGESN
jgi:hypothetical protein